MNFRISGIILSLCFLMSCSIFKNKEERSLVGKEFTTESGLKYKLLKAGDGERAEKGDIAVVHYLGRFTNDTVFDSSWKRGKPFQFKIGEGKVIKGWDEGLTLMNVGDSMQFTIPPDLAYGEKGMGGIPANSTLIFDVKLLDLISPPEAWDTEGKDTVTTASGLQYIKLKENPNGEKAQPGKTVSVHYTGFLENGEIFDSSIERGEPISFPLGAGRVIKGWDEGIAQMRAGEKMKLIIPPDLGYGKQGHPPVIPENATLIFDVELMEVK